MITHIVLFKLNDRNDKSLEKVRDILMNMKDKIPELMDIEVGTDLTQSDRSYDIALVTKFNSVEDLEAYQINPIHIKVSDYMISVRESSVTVDFESN